MSVETNSTARLSRHSHDTFEPWLVGGRDTTQAEEQKFPWVAVVLFERAFGRYRIYDAGPPGCLIHPRLVLTAGHVLRQDGSDLVKKNDDIVIGRHCQNGNAGEKAAKVEQIHVDAPAKADLGLIELQDDVQGISPIQRADASWISEIQQGTYVGWNGSLRMAAPGTSDAAACGTRLQSLSLPIIGNSLCKEVHGPMNGFEFCTGRPGAGICIGGSGIPFVAERNGTWYLVGVARVGRACEAIENGYRSIFTDVTAAEIKDWPESHF